MDQQHCLAAQATVGSPAGFLCVQVDNCRQTLCGPVFEVNGRPIGQEGWQLAGQGSGRALANGGTEQVYLLREATRSVELTLMVRTFPGSPFVRFRMALEALDSGVLTKVAGKDNITYTSLDTRRMDGVTELQLSQFDPLLHSFIPHFQTRSASELAEGIMCPGPVLLLSGEAGSALLGYEHGAAYPDSYLAFDVVDRDGSIATVLRARRGNYYTNEPIVPGKPFVSPWLHFAFVPGDQQHLLAQYRAFFLHHICEYDESRKPYIFYNTWNNQERNKYYHNLPYLHSMHLEHTLAEIETAAQIGVDVFVIDTGWYNKTGDWIVNPRRFPDGLRQVKERLDAHGMKLGLWFNPIVAAQTSDVMQHHPEWRMSLDGQDSDWGPIWETEESWGMCLASGYTDYFIQKMVELRRTLGVTYFKWDAIGQYGCNAPHHNHGGAENTPQERLECYSYRMALEMIRIVEEVQRQCPDVIVDFDITEGARAVGLGFLSVGKYFLINNGPYYANFDIPADFKRDPDPINVFFHPGAARARVCRQSVRFDSFLPSILFLTHFLPDKPEKSQRNSIASLVLGGNGIWGDLSSLDDGDIARLRTAIDAYKIVAPFATSVPAKCVGFVGSSPEIYEKLDVAAAKGFLCFFTHEAGTFEYVTDCICTQQFHGVSGADAYTLTEGNRLRITVRLEADDARVVFIR